MVLAVSTTGRVMTVLGPVSEAELGVTLPHEHVMCDMARSMYVPHPDAGACVSDRSSSETT